MKRKHFLVLAVVAVLLWSAGGRMLQAAEFEPYLKAGTLNLRDGKINEGHKFLVSVGLNIASQTSQRLQGIISLEAWKMAEPADEDGEIPGQGLGAAFEGRYNFRPTLGFKIYPFASLGLQYWERDGSAKTKDSWRRVSFIDVKTGGGVEYRSFYARAALRAPIESWTNEDGLSSRLGFEGEAGLKILGKLKLGLFYDRVNWHQNAKDGVLQANRWGGRIGWIF